MIKITKIVKNSNIYIAALIFILSFLYYYCLSSKIWTWLFVTGDTGDWLQFLNWWSVPHAFGSPLFISLIRLIGITIENAGYTDVNLFLSVIPAAITCVVTYLIALHLTNRKSLSIIAILVILGSSFMLMNATVFEEYMITGMFVSIAYLAYLKDKFSIAVVFLGLGTAVHMIVVFLAIIWFAAEWRQYKRLLKLVPIYIVVGLLPYTLILYLMAIDTPKLITGYLSFGSLNAYLGLVNQTGNLSMQVIPERLLDMSILILGSFGLSLYALYIGLRYNKSKAKLVAIGSVAWIVWFWFSCAFFSVFKYMVIIMPMLAAFIAVGLNHLNIKHSILVTLCAICLIVTNSIYLNPDKLAKQDPQAVIVHEYIMSIEDGSAVITPRGGAYGYSFFYALSKGKDLIPLIVTHGNGDTINKRYDPDEAYKSHLIWFNKQGYPISGNDHYELANDALNKGIPVYLLNYSAYDNKDVYTVEPTEVDEIVKVIDINYDNWKEYIESHIKDNE